MPPVKLSKTKVKLYPYGVNQPLPVLDYFQVESDTKIAVAKFFVIKDGIRSMDNLLGKDLATLLGLLQIVKQMTKISSLNDLVKGYPEVFRGIGKFKNVTAKLHIDPNVLGIIQKHCRVPFHLRIKVENELQQLLQAGIIEKVNKPSEWISPIVIVPKKDSDEVCMCRYDPTKQSHKKSSPFHTHC